MNIYKNSAISIIPVLAQGIVQMVSLLLLNPKQKLGAELDSGSKSHEANNERDERCELAASCAAVAADDQSEK